MLLREHKVVDANADLSAWGAMQLGSLGWTLATRLLRGAFIRGRLGRSTGFVLAERSVRLHHPGFISAGRMLSLEEGCELVGISKRGVVFGDRCTVGRFATVRPSNVLFDEPGEGLRVGDGSNIGAYSFVGCSGFIEIGSNVMMGPRVTLLAETHNHGSTDVTIKSQGTSRSFITIGDDCWLGANSTILPGVTIGTGSIVGAGSVVTEDVPSFSLVAGVPARVIRSRR